MGILAESQRAPFDFSEGESELVSGFNTEFGSVLFSFIFLSEHGIIIFSVAVLSFLFRTHLGGFFVILLWGRIIILVVLVRAVRPRLRFDILQIVSWKVLLPIILAGFFVRLLWV